ncbi:hypothetical protein ACEPPN_008431 [Leptodophora sp. 'Broadleaf-Isolate-01']
MWTWILFQTYVVSQMFGKLSIIAFLLEFERNVPAARKWLLYVVAFINVAVNMGTSSLQWQQCKPVAKTWDDDIAGVTVACAILKTVGISLLDATDTTCKNSLPLDHVTLVSCVTYLEYSS